MKYRLQLSVLDLRRFLISRKESPNSIPAFAKRDQQSQYWKLTQQFLLNRDSFWYQSS